MWDEAQRIVRQAVPSVPIELSEIEELRIVERGEEHDLIDIDDAELRLYLNLDALNDETRREFVGSLVETFESQHRLFAGDPNEIREATTEVLTEGDIKDIVEYFGEYIRGAYLQLLERSLSIDRAWHIRDISPERMDDSKEDIASDFVDQTVGHGYNDAYTSIHMAGSGYYQEGGDFA